MDNTYEENNNNSTFLVEEFIKLKLNIIDFLKNQSINIDNLELYENYNKSNININILNKFFSFFEQSVNFLNENVNILLLYFKSIDSEKRLNLLTNLIQLNFFKKIDDFLALEIFNILNIEEKSLFFNNIPNKKILARLLDLNPNTDDMNLITSAFTYMSVCNKDFYHNNNNNNNIIINNELINNNLNNDFFISFLLSAAKKDKKQEKMIKKMYRKYLTENIHVFFYNPREISFINKELNFNQIDIFLIITNFINEQDFFNIQSKINPDYIPTLLLKIIDLSNILENNSYFKFLFDNLHKKNYSKNSINKIVYFFSQSFYFLNKNFAYSYYKKEFKNISGIDKIQKSKARLISFFNRDYDNNLELTIIIYLFFILLLVPSIISLSFFIITFSYFVYKLKLFKFKDFGINKIKELFLNLKNSINNSYFENLFNDSHLLIKKKIALNIKNILEQQNNNNNKNFKIIDLSIDNLNKI